MPSASADASASESATSTAPSGAGRLVGLDIARCLALLGMVTTHVLETRTPAGDLTIGHWLAAGRASALFAVLAGLTLALLSGRTEPVRGRAWWAATGGLLARAALIALLGMALGGLGSGIAIILTYYGVLFALGIPFLLIRARTLFLLAAAWVVIAPAVSHVVRAELPPRGSGSPTFASLADPLVLLSELTFTGYYPVVPWLSYLLVGMGLGRSDLRDRRVAQRLTAVGAVLMLAATGLSRWLLSLPSVAEPLMADLGVATPDQLRTEIEGGLFGTTPSPGAWEWLLVGVPHSGTPFDLAATIGSALLVIGLFQLLVVLLSERAGLAATATRTLRVLFGAGTMTLTLYTMHVLMRTPSVWPPDTPETYPIHLVALVAVGALYAAVGSRGPLEQVVGFPGRWLRRRVSG